MKLSTVFLFLEVALFAATVAFGLVGLLSSAILSASGGAMSQALRSKYKTEERNAAR